MMRRELLIAAVGLVLGLAAALVGLRTESPSRAAACGCSQER